MSIIAADVKLYKSQEMNDNDTGGGVITTTEVADGTPGDIFPSISRMDKSGGVLNLRKIFAKIDSDNDDLYAGAHAVLTSLSTDTDVHELIVDDSDADERADVVISSSNSYGVSSIESSASSGQKEVEVSNNTVAGYSIFRAGDTVLLKEGATEEEAAIGSISTPSAYTGLFKNSNNATTEALSDAPTLVDGAYTHPSSGSLLIALAGAGIDLKSAVSVDEMIISCSRGTVIEQSETLATSSKFELYYSTDGVNWTLSESFLSTDMVLTFGVYASKNYAKLSISFASAISYRYLKVFVPAGKEIALNGIALELSCVEIEVYNSGNKLSPSTIKTLVMLNNLTNSYTTAGLCCSCCPLGNLQADKGTDFTQETWDGATFSDTQSGAAASGTYNFASYPLTVNNHDAITDRIGLDFTSSTEFNIISERYGNLGTGDTSTAVEPNNPLTSDPYFSLSVSGWGGVWQSGNVLRFNVIGAMKEIWLARTIEAGATGTGADGTDIELRGDV